MKSIVKAAAVLVIAIACSSGKHEQQAKPALTERQRDSLIARSKLPGAGVVGKAMEQADSAKARADRPIPEAP